jgi:signal peptidase II
VRRYGPVIIAAIAAVVLLADQVTKHLARTLLAQAGEPIRVVGDVIRLTFTRNEGAAFGMLPGNVYLFIPVHVLVVLVIAGYVWRRRPERPWIITALGLVTGGALGNLIDRVAFGWVTDFIQIPFDFPVFNVADSAVVVGVGMLVWWLLFGPESRESHGATPQQPSSDAATGDLDVDAVPEDGESSR